MEIFIVEGDIMRLFASQGFSISANVVEELLDLEKGTLDQINDDNIVIFPKLLGNNV